MIYSSLKKFTKRILPGSLLVAAEPLLRNIFSLTYAGSKVHCPICEGNFSRFILLENGKDMLCPRCGSLPRNRLLWLFLQKEINIASKNLKVLHFSPSRSLMRRLRKLNNLDYTTTDYESSSADKQLDITNITEPDNAYDLVICYHVLEHIPDDAKAMDELYRILKHNGTALVQVPLKEGSTFEDPSITSRPERLKNFGQEDHVRIYGNDFAGRLRNSGFLVTIKEYAKRFSPEDMERFGLWPEEKIFVCEK